MVSLAGYGNEHGAFSGSWCATIGPFFTIQVEAKRCHGYIRRIRLDSQPSEMTLI
jgi:hypothetical protein